MCGALLADLPQLRIFFTGYDHFSKAGISQPILSLRISRSAISAAPRLVVSATRGTTNPAPAGCELADAPRNHIDQGIGATDLLQCSSY
jgi:hypothetical protein